MIALRVEAPFAACRTFTAGWYRPTATFLTPSAAYGLLLNVAGIEARLREADDGYPAKPTAPATLMRLGLPKVRIAVGKPDDAGYPRVQSVYQQLHNYPVGASGEARAADAKGNKYNITPVRREFLSDLKAVIAVDGEPDFENRIRDGLSSPNADRYGVPFLGDNAFLLDLLKVVEAPTAYWYERVAEASSAGPRPRTTRLTVLIDRGDLSRTTSALYAPTEEASADIPEQAWTLIAPP
jgi:CRISPR-associated protein Cas5t